ncbi:MAG: class I adenylate-forming enzyme family protein [Bacillota bacterium]
MSYQWELPDVEKLTLGAMLERSAQVYPSREAIVFQDRRYSYQEYNDIVDTIARAYLELGIQKGDRIALIIPTRPEFLFCYLAAAKIGAILVGLNVRYRGTEFEYMLNNSQPSLLIAVNKYGDGDFSGILRNITMPTVKNIVFFGETDYPGALNIDDFFLRPRPHLDDQLRMRSEAVEPGDGVFMVYTSGTTGRPKGALMSHESILTQVKGQIRMEDLGPDDRTICHVPLTHVGGGTIAIVGCLTAASTLVLMEAFDPVKTLEMIEKERITVLGQVPTMWIFMLKEEVEKYDLSSLRFVLVSAASAPPDVVRQVMKRICPVFANAYGSTEVSGFATYTRPDDDIETQATTVGKAWEELELKLVDNKRQPVPVGEIGEIAMRGKQVFMGYYNMPQETAEAIDSEGWFYSGDLAKMDERGYLTIQGRTKEMYISGGYNIYPREVEEVLMKHPDVILAACVGVPDDIWGEKGRAYIIPKPGIEITPFELKDFCKKLLADYKVPKEFIFKTELPMTPVGKVAKAQLMQEIKDELERASAKSSDA